MTAGDDILDDLFQGCALTAFLELAHAQQDLLHLRENRLTIHRKRNLTMFDEHTQWTEHPCYYVIAFQAFRRAWLAGPYRTRAEAATVLPHVISWAASKSGDSEAANYTYQVIEHHNGEARSILGELNADSLSRDLETAANAPLIASAPELLQSLQEVLPFAEKFVAYLVRSVNECCGTEDIEAQGKILRAQALLAKATA